VIYEVIDPTAGSIYCTVEWDNEPGTGYISLQEDVDGGFDELSVDIGQYSIITSIIGSPGTRSTISCSAISPSSCNLIANNNFTPSTTYDPSNLDPFTTGDIPNWTSSHGTPQIYDGFYPTLQPPSPATGFAYMYAKSPVPPNLGPTGEGIAQKIPALATSATYHLSFFLRFSDWPNGSSQLDNFYIILLKCSDFNSFPTSPSTLIPSVPTNSQIVYHGTSISNQSWSQIQITFVANDSYDIIWIFPKQDNGERVSVNFAFPILNEISSFVISPTGPINICSPWEYAPTNTSLLTSSSTTSGQYQWYKDGQPISGATSSTHYAQHNQQGVDIRTHIYTVKDPVNGCTSASVTVNFVPTPLTPVESVGNLAKNTWHTIRTTQNISPATYSWSIPGATVIDYNTADPWVDVFFPSSASSPVTGYVTINGGASCANSTYTYEFNLSASRSMNVEDLSIIQNSEDQPSQLYSKLFPNPAKNIVTVNSFDLIQKIEIYSLTGALVKAKQVLADRVATLNIHDLNPGVYSIKVFSNNNVTTLRLVVQR